MSMPKYLSMTALVYISSAGLSAFFYWSKYPFTDDYWRLTNPEISEILSIKLGTEFAGCLKIVLALILKTKVSNLLE